MPGPSARLGALGLYDVAWREYPGAYWDQWAVVDWMEARADPTRSREYVWALAEIAGVPHADYCDYCRTKRSDTSPCKHPRLTLKLRDPRRTGPQRSDRPVWPPGA